MEQFFCDYLQDTVELTEEREVHITHHHPDLLPESRHCLAETLAHPDQVRQSRRFGSARLFSRWYPDLKGGKHVVIVVVSEAVSPTRHWIITAYLARKLIEGDIEWKRN